MFKSRSILPSLSAILAYSAPFSTHVTEKSTILHSSHQQQKMDVLPNDEMAQLVHTSRFSRLWLNQNFSSKIVAVWHLRDHEELRRNRSVLAGAA
jgi:hypothetical protein